MRLIFLLIFFTLLTSYFSIKAQVTNVSEKVSEVSFDKKAEIKKPTKRYFSFKNRTSYFNPLAYVGSTLLFIYQKVISQQIQANCAYQTSCSEYTRLSIQQHGFILGTLNGLNQISECFEGAIYEHPPVFINQTKIINSLD